ncbi:hypothetical protein JBKA6_0214 [Ichthyobacterium seriolicida]|uniref:TonB C-terminal domain-containing protein n=1 Tax=Ichthyobacterium seriolicida TaxID=242600 RepID=A0A1J1E8G7_9FLAO|nr:hypothetical protein JBKA6_0214 [Ichthyobacterium seriolicida]
MLVFLGLCSITSERKELLSFLTVEFKDENTLNSQEKQDDSKTDKSELNNMSSIESESNSDRPSSLDIDDFSVEKFRNSLKTIERMNDIKDRDKDLFDDEIIQRDIEHTEVNDEHLTQDLDTTEDLNQYYTGESTINFSLKDRYQKKILNPIYKCIEQGFVVIDIKVDRLGEVIEVSFNKKKSTTLDKCLIDTALSYAKKSSFNRDDNALEYQNGFISFLFSK